MNFFKHLNLYASLLTKDAHSLNGHISQNAVIFRFRIKNKLHNKNNNLPKAVPEI